MGLGYYILNSLEIIGNIYFNLGHNMYPKK